MRDWRRLVVEANHHGLFMFILPLEFGYETNRRAWLTFVLVALMLLIHWHVESNAEKVGDAVWEYCDSDRGEAFSRQLQQLARDSDGERIAGWSCGNVMTVVVRIGDKPATYDYLLANGELDALSEQQLQQFDHLLRDEVAKARIFVPQLLQEKLAQPAQSWNPVRWLTSTFAHADWWHVIFNMVFLVAFGCILEVVLGPIVYLGFIFAAALSTGLAYAVVTTVTGDGFSMALGFSGADFALLGALLFLMPFAPIKSIVFIGIIPIPMRLGVWVFGLVFLGGELWFLLNHGPFDESSGVNVLAHAVGGVTGFGLAAWSLRPLKRQLTEMLDRAHLQQWSQR